MAEIKINITAIDNASPAFNAVEQAGTVATSKMRSAFDGLKTHWLAISAAIAGAAITIKQAWDMVDAWASFAEQKSALDALAQKYSSSADSIISSIQSVSKGLIGVKDATATATEALSKGLDPTQITELARAAEMLSDTAGVSVPQAFQMLSEAVALGRERSAEALVGIIDLNAKYGEQVNKMSDAEKATARYTLVMEKVDAMQGRLGNSTDTVSDKMARVGVKMGDLKIVAGEYLYRAFMALYGSAQWLASGALNLAGGLMKVGSAAEWITDKLHITDARTKYWKENAEAAFGAAEELAGKAADAFSLMAASSADLTSAAGGLRDTKGAMDEVKNAADASATGMENLKNSASTASKTLKNEAQEAAAATMNMAKSFGVSLDQFLQIVSEKFGPNSPAILGIRAFKDAMLPLKDIAFNFNSAGLAEFISLMETSFMPNSPAILGIRAFAEEAKSLREPINIKIDVSQALSAVNDIKSSIASIPDVSYKTVIVQYQTQASPIMPFTEGINHIKNLMSSLPGEGTYRVKILNAEDIRAIALAGGDATNIKGIALSGGVGLPPTARGSIGTITGTTVNLSPTINISGAGKDGRALADEIDTELADKIRTDRSRVMPAIRSKL